MNFLSAQFLNFVCSVMPQTQNCVATDCNLFRPASCQHGMTRGELLMQILMLSGEHFCLVAAWV